MFDPAFIGLLTEAVGEEKAGVVSAALASEPSVSVRLNPAKLTVPPFPDAVPVPWSPFGWLLPERPSFTLDPLFHAGCYYVQDSSAMAVGEIFRRVMDRLPEHPAVLDLCAAPGGKTTDLSASLRARFGDGFTLIANEVIRSRFRILRENVAVWGDPRTGVTSRDPSAFPARPAFDAVVADVPCSGEGMFRKDPKAVRDWSPETVGFCAARQRRILSDIWPSLKEGGILVYSTCTFNRLENDGNVAWIAAELGAEILDCGDLPGVGRTEHGHILLPGFVPGEGQYAAVLRKTAPSGPPYRGDLMKDLGAEMPAQVPDGNLPRYDLDRDTALRYLHGDALRLPADAPKGPLLLTYRDHPLGPAKNLGTRCNNLYPKERRIRMDVSNC